MSHFVCNHWFDDGSAYWMACRVTSRRLAELKRKLEKALVDGNDQQAEILDEKITHTRTVFMKLEMLMGDYFNDVPF